jgi:trimeric autotransporter adhesin
MTLRARRFSVLALFLALPSALAAFDAASGNLLAWNPNDNGVVRALKASPAGTRVYVGSDFALVNGHSRRNAAAVSTGIVTLRSWSPSATADVAGDIDVSASGRTVFVGGRSTGGYAQAYGPTGGTPVWNVPTNGDVEAIVVSSSILYIGGQFTTVGAASRGHLAALAASGGALQSWNPGADGVFDAFDAAITSSRVAFGGEFAHVAGENHQGVAQFSGTP